jgi:5-carboxymethyl-2-hydroxymuconate isomerase
MRIARIVTDTEDDYAILAEGGRWVPFRTLGVDAVDVTTLPGAIERIRSVDSALAPGDAVAEPRLLCPVVRPGKIMAVGLNYEDHIRETDSKRPQQPLVFAKYPSSLNGPRDPIVVDRRLTEEPDYEAELAVVIGTTARWVPAERAVDHILGYTVANDVSARDHQRTDGQFSRSKSMDTFCPLGPWITTRDEVDDPQALGIRSFVNDEIRQDSTTAEMIFGVYELVEYLSRTMTLEPGDVILTGTPPGVGLGMTPPVFLADGDVVRCEIDGLGHIENRVTTP